MVFASGIKNWDAVADATEYENQFAEYLVVEYDEDADTQGILAVHDFLHDHGYDRARKNYAGNSIRYNRDKDK